MKNNFNFKIFASRRKLFINELPDKSLVILSNGLVLIYSNDVEHKFKPDSDFYYLTGVEEPNSICILKKDKKSFQYLLYIEQQEKEKEKWVGKKLNKEKAKAIYLVDETHYLQEFDTHLKKLFQGAEHIFLPIGKNKTLDLKITNLINSINKNNRNGIKAPKNISDPRPVIHKMRLIKDNYEISCIQRAAEISREAHILSMSYARPGIYEHELEALIEYKFRSRGALGPAYPSIVGSGKNCTVLHYIKNNKKIQNKDLILVDAGCEYNYYASDVTRTYPANKKFLGAQKDIYEIILEAQLQAIEKIKPGKKFSDSYNKAVQVLVEGLKELKLLKGSTEKIIKKGEYKKFFMHKLGHWLGLDVHDAGPYFDERGNSIKLRPGMVMTVEPGIYISNNLQDIPQKFRGIGIRIEDDVLVTNYGNKILTSGIPKTISEIESLS
ncbi:MAG: aminopeptidase P N-terminal domain-containing protein [Candidatus Melainabacteria bacterium]|nr:aminopeptidase P N-terminal domain-containing protein [Candidatus Melainabacteria bacterium]